MSLLQVSLRIYSILMILLQKTIFRNVLLESGDGCMFGEGGNHFIHTIRRNPNITNIIHDNFVYGLTKGQASPTSRPGFMTPVQVDGVILDPFNPLAIAIGLGASFVARTFAGDQEHMKTMMKKAMKHKRVCFALYSSTLCLLQ